MGQVWGRLYTGTRNHRKFTAIRRKHKDTWTYLYVLMECSFETDDDGKIYVNPNLPYSIEELADEIHFHKSTKFLRDLIETAVKVGLFSYENQIPKWLSYSERQFKSDHDVNERVRKYREKKKLTTPEKHLCNVTETLHGNKHETDHSIAEQNILNTPLTPLEGGGDNGKKNRRKKKADRTLPPFSDDFLKIWEVYPNPTGGKEEAWSIWLSRIKKKTLPPIPYLSECIDKLINDDQWMREDGKYVPNITTFLNQGRWTDADRIKTKTKPHSDPDCPQCHGKGMYPRPDGKPGQMLCDCRRVDYDQK